MAVNDTQEVKAARAEVRRKEAAPFDRAIEAGRQSRSEREQSASAKEGVTQAETQRKGSRLSVG